MLPAHRTQSHAARRRAGRASRTRRGDARSFVAALVLVLAPPLLAGAASGAPGSGSATILPTNDVVAGSRDIWTIQYDPAEDFDHPQGGVVEFEIPAGWTAPQNTSSSSPGWVTPVVGASFMASMTITGRVVRVVLGQPSAKFQATDFFALGYGTGGGNARPYADTLAPATAVFLVRSDPSTTDGITPVAIASSPSLNVVPDVVTSVRIVDASLAPIDTLQRTADDAVSMSLRGYDKFGNSARFVAGSWSATGGIGSFTPSQGTSATLNLAGVGSGFAVADSGAWRDSTGAVTVTHGAYAALAATAAGSAAAGSPFAATAEARDADGNRVTSGAGSAAALRFVAYQDSLGPSTADPAFVDDRATLASGYWDSTLSAQTAGTYFLAARDSAASRESSPRVRVVIVPTTPDNVSLVPDTLRLVAGAPDTVTVIVRDAFGNRVAVAADEELTLWTDRPAGRFGSLSGTQIFSVSIPAGSDSTRFQFRDTQRTTAAGRIRAIDANGAPPFMGTAAAPVFTDPGAPSGTVALSAVPDTLVAGGADSAQVASAVVRDAYANVVATGERFTVTGTGLTILTDEDPGAAGAQWTTSAGGTLSGWARAGAVSGPAGVQVASERGTAAGTAAVRLLAGPPSGPVALAADPDSLVADSVSVRSVTGAGLVDANGNMVEDGEAYTVATTLGSIGSPDADASEPGIQVRASGGAIAFDVVAGDALGTAVVSAASVRGSSSGGVNVRLVPGPVGASASTASAGTPVPVGPPGSTLTVTLRDAQDHPLPGVPADSIAVGAAGLAAAIAPLASSTDASGVIEYEVTSTVTGTATLSITARGVLLDDRPNVLFEPGPLDTLHVTGPAGPLTAGTAYALTVEARDAFGNAMPARSDLVNAAVTSGAASGLPASVNLSSGTASIPFTPTLAGPLSIQVADDSSHVTAYGPVLVASGAAHRLLADAPAAGTLAAGDSTTVTARVYDANGNSVSSASVSASVVQGGGGVDPGSALTNAFGAAVFTIRAGGVPGEVVVRMLATGSAAHDSIRADSAAVVVVPGAAQSVAVTPSAGAMIAGDFLATTLTLRDAFGNVAWGATPQVSVGTTSALPDSVSWVASPGTFGALDDSASGDGALYAFAAADSGTAVLRVRATRAETIRLQASGAGPPSVESADVVVQPAAAAVLAGVDGDGQSAVVGRELPLPLRALARDAYGNPVPGAGVVFGVASGGGSIDVVRGGGADSIAVTDASGIATCDVARLGTVAGPGSDVFRARLEWVPAAEVSFTESALPDTAASLAIAPGSLALAPTGAATVTATARDAYGNPAPGTVVTLYLGAAAAGTLESQGSTSGGGTAQSGPADGSGEVSVRYRAPGAAPASDSIFARGISIAPVAIRADVAPAGIASLRLRASAATWTAGVAESVWVDALDAFGNLAVADTATVVLGATDAVSFSPGSGSLAGGVFRASASATLADTLVLTAGLASGAVSDSAGPISVLPAAPSGAIAVSATRTELTADGRSAAVVAFGPVRDSLGNVTPAGTLLTVTAQAGSLLAADASPLPGLQIATAADDTARVALTAPSVPGSELIQAASVSGTASGSIAITYVPPPSIVFEPDSLRPTVVQPAQSAAFTLFLRNTGSGAVSIDTSSMFAFGAGPDAFATGPAAPLSIAPGTGGALALTPRAVSGALAPGTYAPSVRLKGSDGTGEPFDFYVSVAGAQVHVAGVLVTPLAAAPDPVPLGHGDLRLSFEVRNQAAVTGTLASAGLTFTTGAFTVNGFTPALPATLPGSGTLTVTASVSVPPSGIAAGTSVGSTLGVNATFGPAGVSAQNAAPLTFQAASAAQVAATPGGATPARYLRSRTSGPSVRVQNTGATAVTLSGGATRLVLTQGASRLESGLSASAVVTAGGFADLAFDSLSVPGASALGTYAAALVLSGTESGQAFADTIPLAPATVEIVEPPILAVVGSVAPDSVSAGQTRALQVVVGNSGGIPFAMSPATRLVLGPPVNAVLSPAAVDTVAAGGSLTLAFAAQPIGFSGSPGTASATLEARGAEDGRIYEESLAAGSLAAMPPAVLAYVGGSTLPDTMRAGQTLSLSASIRNDGGSAFVVDPAATRLVITDGVESAVALASGAPFTLPPAGAGTLSFPSLALPAALASQPYPVRLVVHGTEWGQSDSASVSSPPAEVLVVEPVVAIQARGFDPGAPIQVAPEDGPFPLWSLELEPLIPPGGAASAQLESAGLTVVVDGVATANPGAAVARIELRDAQDNVLAAALPGAANPVPLGLAAPLPLNGPPVTLRVVVELRPGAAARTVALRVASDTDLFVRDDLTLAAVPVRATGGLPFAPLSSRAVTLFAKAHGYPNPFRAGREDIRISYRLGGDASVRIAIYTLLGDLVREIALPAGTAGGSPGLNEVAWDGRNGKGQLVRPGVYVAQVEGGGVSERIKVGVLR